MVMNEMIDSLFEKGYQPILLREGGKAAAFREWQHHCMDRKEIGWWLERRRFNLGVLLRSGRGPPLIVVDRDSRDAESWSWVRTHRLNRTPMQTETVHHGWHLWHRLPETIADVRTRIKFVAGIDLKLTGYCVVPPSVVEGRQYLFRGKHKGLAPITDLPFFPTEILKEQEQKPTVVLSGERYHGPVTREVRFPEAYALRIESHQGANGSAGLVRAVCVFRDARKSEQEAFDFLMSRWNVPPRVTPPWSPEEIIYAIHRHFKQ